MEIRRPGLEAWFTEHHPGVRFDLGGTMVPADLSLLRAVLPDTVFDGRYADTRGSLAARELLAGADGLQPDDLVLCCGATEANVAALLACVQPGSVAVLQDPLYYQFEPWLRLLGIDVRAWRADSSSTWS
ncbi:MAG: aminotransferase class I/II-fold pyridoxal phosphate-dependent enzyme, partial [Cyanobacteria bacterium REEB65]|nr:aminotransferase class I/II-fold pyridoxal phosphate-dependent enzyme [Cyanobacteria bacterium REEB65]